MSSLSVHVFRDTLQSSKAKYVNIKDTFPNGSKSGTGLSCLAMNDCNVSLTIRAETVNISLQDALSKNVLALEMMERLIFL